MEGGRGVLRIDGMCTAKIFSACPLVQSGEYSGQFPCKGNGFTFHQGKASGYHCAATVHSSGYLIL